MNYPKTKQILSRFPPEFRDIYAKLGDVDYFERARGVAFIGSRAWDCARPDSDWDVLIIGETRDTIRIPGLDLIFADPETETDIWYQRDMAFHASGWAKWMYGRQMWDTGKLEWEVAEKLRARRVLSSARIFADIIERNAFGRADNFARRHAHKLTDEARRLIALRQRIFIAPTARLPELEPIAEILVAQKALESIGLWMGTKSVGVESPTSGTE